eukprot:CAMPEP_0206471156 /NCGR_PEP_ID=MMETSP0324_2-20121206/31381_1 /ASSEMBLY_ACC=CAM_ASM_000836 /TAXON_ID=2866 /ORGANISM="Crypthecodinium cohnii, Strain Seligo" /LENGTH=268 /DNA_ID=CAMNT_0053945399 /DNA_START=211 /DNA_END=1017 /DNA_ORIENTATION=-
MQPGDATRKKAFVYASTGVHPAALRHALRFLETEFPELEVSKIGPKDILKGALSDASVALLLMPGGADRFYAQKLGSEGIQLIRKFIEGGGGYVGICAGAYFGSSYCEFDKGGPLEVCDPRELALHSGRAVGSAFGYDYESSKFAKAVDAVLKDDLVKKADLSTGRVASYVNGGCFFPDAKEDEVLAYFCQDCGGHAAGQPMVVGGSAGSGRYILTGAHLEYDPEHLDPCREHDEIAPTLKATDTDRRNLMKFLVASVLRGSDSPSRL